MPVRPLGEHTVADVREDPQVVAALIEITGLPEASVENRVREAHGAKQLSKLFADVWPSTAAALGGRTAAFARNHGFHSELRRLTRRSAMLVTRRLNQANGRTLLRNVFYDCWPDESAGAAQSEEPDVQKSDDTVSQVGGPTFLRYSVPIVDVLRELGNAASAGDVVDRVIERLDISSDELAETTSNGQSRVRNQIHWARFYLAKAGIIDRSQRGVWRLTEDGVNASLDPEAVFRMFKRVHSSFDTTDFDDDAPTSDAPSVEPVGDGEQVSLIETEDVSADGITSPFDPNKIRVKLWTPTVDLVLKRLRANEIDLAADFQRAAGIWRDQTQSRLIESLLIRIPLPTFYVDGGDEDRLLVIDGIQRLTAIRRFVLDDELVLNGLEYLAELEGKRFSDLPRPFQRRIEETMLTVYVIDKGTPEAAKLNIFRRLNTGGMPLTQQEIRHAMSPGPVRDFLRRLASARPFYAATAGGFDDQRMSDRECVLRFCAFVLTAPNEYPAPGDLDRFLLDAMRTINSQSNTEREWLARRLDRAMLAANRVLGDDAFRKPRRNNRRLPVNKALFEAWAVAFDARSDDEIERLVARRERVKSAFVELVANSREFEAALSQGTGDPSKVRLRFSALDHLLRSVSS